MKRVPCSNTITIPWSYIFVARIKRFPLPDMTIGLLIEKLVTVCAALSLHTTWSSQYILQYLSSSASCNSYLAFSSNPPFTQKKKKHSPLKLVYRFPITINCYQALLGNMKRSWKVFFRREFYFERIWNLVSSFYKFTIPLYIIHPPTFYELSIYHISSKLSIPCRKFLSLKQFRKVRGLCRNCIFYNLIMTCIK